MSLLLGSTMGGAGFMKAGGNVLFSMAHPLDSKLLVRRFVTGLVVNVAASGPKSRRLVLTFCLCVRAKKRRKTETWETTQ